MAKKPMPILLIEDDIIERKKFKSCAEGRADIALVGMTDCSDEALMLVKDRLPEGVIVDLELSKGKGDGLQFLSELREAKLGLRPIVVVTTNIQSEVMYNHLHDFGISFIFSKKQNGYSQNRVLDMLLLLRKSLPILQNGEIHSGLATVESPDEIRDRINERIDAELSQLGINLRLKGRHYLNEALYLLINKEKNESSAVLYQVADNNRVNYNTVIRAIQTALENAWLRTDIDTLRERCPVHIDVRTGAPSPTEFIRYLSDKIRKTM
ncbi:MAG: response regulator [Defluviitaleaceae bacterium]|nr:response regulator [Defluviitaleaceae bacterium]